MPNKNKYLWTLPVIFFLTVLMHTGTFMGLGTDFQAYALSSKLVFHGQTPYVDFIDNKPPLIYFLLLPGNLIGGKFISFFMMYLLYVGLVNLLIFHFGAQIKEKNNIHHGLWAWMIINFCTVIQFYNYGNLNGSIVYMSMGFNLISFFLLLKAQEKLDLKNFQSHKYFFLSGLFCGLAFMTRYDFSVMLVCGVLLLSVWLRKQIALKQFFLLLSLCGLGFILSIMAILAVIGFPWEGISDVLAFNLTYSRLDNKLALSHNNFFLIKIAGRFFWYLTFVLKYGLLPFIIIFLAFIKFIKVNSSQLKHKTFNAIKITQNSKIMWLTIFVIFEYLLVLPAGTESKQYPYFTVLIPLSLVSAYALGYLLESCSLFLKQRATFIMACIFCMCFIFVFFKNQDRLISVMQWPEQELTKEIRKRIKHDKDFFTVDFAPYLYLETGTIPPFKRSFYHDSFWSFYHTNPDLEKQLWNEFQQLQLPSVVVRYSENSVTLPESGREFMNNYKLVGTFPASYRGPKQLYVLK